MAKKNDGIILKAAAYLAEEIGADAIIILTSKKQKRRLRTEIPVLYVSKEFSPIVDYMMGSDLSSDVACMTMNRIEQVRNAAVGAFMDGEIKGNLIVGVTDFNRVDSIVILDLSEVETVSRLKDCAERVSMNVLRSTLQLALDIGKKGYEGRSIGTAFIIGDSEEVLKRSHQLILNPFAGHPESRRYITDLENWETLREFSQLDGIFVIDDRGMVITAGRYIDVDAKHVKTQKGLGGRHIAAAAITRDTQAVVVTVSETGGTIRVYRDGLPIVKLESGLR